MVKNRTCRCCRDMISCCKVVGKLLENCWETVRKLLGSAWGRGVNISIVDVAKQTMIGQVPYNFFFVCLLSYH